MPSLKRLVVLAAVALIPAACLFHHPPPSFADNTPATLHVENHNWQDVDLQVLHRGLRTRLGDVTGASAKDFVFPRALMGDLGEIQLIAHAIGTPESITTGVIVLKPGTQVQWTIESSLSRSTLSVY